MRAQYSFEFLLSSLVLVSLLLLMFSLIYPVYFEIKNRMYSRIEEVISEYVKSECDVSRITRETRLLNISSPRAFYVHTSCGTVYVKPGYHTYSITYYNYVFS